MNIAQHETPGLNARTGIDRVIQEANRIILGKEHVVRLALSCLLARGHLLIEDMPGVGKTTLAHVLANTLGLSFQRIQFTSDMLPADILGVSTYNRESETFNFLPGPIFSQVILADEVNRTTPRTQSALLEAMEERQVTIEGETRVLPRPFFVIATQNPSYQIGTYPLPESQLDRFTMCLSLGYPGYDAERELLKGRDRRELLAEATPVLDPDQLKSFQSTVVNVTVTESLLEYLQALLEFTRVSSDYATGLSPRAGMAILRSAQSWAFIHARDFVMPEDIQAVLHSVICHRLHYAREKTEGDPCHIGADLIARVPIP